MSLIERFLIVNIAAGMLPAANLDAAPVSPPPSESSETRLPKKPVRISLAEAERLVRNKIFAEKPKMAAHAEFPLRELTTDTVWIELAVQMFKVTSGVREPETFVIKDGEVAHIGRGFGGAGVNSWCIADVDNDGKPELVYSFSSGSGIHRCEVGVLTFAKAGAREYIAPLRYVNPGDGGDLSVRLVEKRVLAFDGRQRLGEVVLERKGETWAAAVRLDKDLPKEFRERVWPSQKKPAESEKR